MATISISDFLYGTGTSNVVLREGWLPSTTLYPTDTTEGYVYIAEDAGTVTSLLTSPPTVETFVVDDAIIYYKGAWTRLGSSGTTLPADAAGALTNNGAGVLTWVPPVTELPADAAGVLTNNGAGSLTWASGGGDITAAGVNTFTGGGNTPATNGTITINFGGTITNGANLVGTNTSANTYYRLEADEGYIGDFQFSNSYGTATFTDLINQLNSNAYGYGTFAIDGGNIVGTTDETGSTSFINVYGTGDLNGYGVYPVFADEGGYGQGADGWVSTGAPVYGTDAVTVVGNIFNNAITVGGRYPIDGTNELADGAGVLTNDGSGALSWENSSEMTYTTILAGFSSDDVIATPALKKSILGATVAASFTTASALGTTIEVITDAYNLNLNTTSGTGGMYDPYHTSVVDYAGSEVTAITVNKYAKFVKTSATRWRLIE